MTQPETAENESDATLECANCGHARRFHTGAEGNVCASPEDGTACTCEGFEPL
jgi:hypothetical protein